jgi:hypothetical protein
MKIHGPDNRLAALCVIGDKCDSGDLAARIGFELYRL